MSKHPSGKGSKKVDVWPGMTQRQHWCVAHYIRCTADALDLGHWTFTLAYEPCDEDATASVDPCYGRHHASISVCHDFMKRSHREQKNAVIHELVHLHEARGTEFLRVALIRQLGQSAYDIMWEAYRQHIEYMTDALANLFTRFTDDSDIRHYLKGKAKP